MLQVVCACEVKSYMQSNNVGIYQHEVMMSEYFATERKGKRQEVSNRISSSCKVN